MLFFDSQNKTDPHIKDVEHVFFLFCDKPQAKVIERAEAFHIPSFAFEPKSYENKAAFEQAIIEQLRLHEVELIVLAGYMRLIGDTLLQAYGGKIINIHPSLLPAFPGIDGSDLYPFLHRHNAR